MSEQLRAAAQAALDAWRQSPHIWQRSAKTLHEAFASIEFALAEQAEKPSAPSAIKAEQVLVQGILRGAREHLAYRGHSDDCGFGLDECTCGHDSLLDAINTALKEQGR